MEPLDDFDLRILDILRIDSRQTGQDLADRIGLSPAACLRRVQRLRKIGAIEREVAIVSPKFTGLSVKILAHLTLNRERQDRVDALKSKLRRLREVEHFYHVTGQADFVLTVVCSSMEEYASFTEAHFYDDLISGFESIVVLREYHKDLGDG